MFQVIFKNYEKKTILKLFIVVIKIWESIVWFALYGNNCKGLYLLQYNAKCSVLRINI